MKNKKYFKALFFSALLGCSALYAEGVPSAPMQNDAEEINATIDCNPKLEDCGEVSSKAKSETTAKAKAVKAKTAKAKVAKAKAAKAKAAKAKAAKAKAAKAKAAKAKTAKAKTAKAKTAKAN